MRGVTAGYRLPSRYVIHAVGPVWQGGGRGEPELLARCYRRAFELAVANGISTLAFPAISCGVYGYPVGPAARIAVAETRLVLAAHPSIEQVLFVCFEPAVRSAYEEALAR